LDKGWWQRSTRLIYEPHAGSVQMSNNNSSPVLIIGKNGTLGRAFARICEDRCLNYRLLSRKDCDISQASDIEHAIQHFKPWAIINTAGFVRVDDAQTDEEACMRDNAHGPHQLALACAKAGIQLLSFSTDLVFDGKKNQPYVENDPVQPLNVYGKSKAHAEHLVLSSMPSALVIRTSAFFGPWDEYNFIQHTRKALSRYERQTTANDIMVSPTYVPHLVHAALDLLIDKEAGIWHLANQGSKSWSDLAFMVAERYELDHRLIQSVSSDQIQFPAPRPKYSVLGSSRGHLLPSLESALEEFFHHEKKENRKVA
jgi:dTDP-4-dehydrorhamnose reductase